MSFITASEVRTESGAPDSLISDSSIELFIQYVEEEMERWLNTSFTPTEKIDIKNGNNNYSIVTDKNPLLSLYAVKIGDDTISLEDLRWNRESGLITTYNNNRTFQKGDNNIKIRYVYGFLEPTDTTTVTSSDVSAGSNVEITVSSITGFSNGDWIEITGMDGHQEAAQIVEEPSGNTLKVGVLKRSHESDSNISKLEIPYFIKRYMIVEAAIGVAINAIGSTYTFNTGYSLGDLNVQKGVPYTHWQSSVSKLIAERKMRKERIKPRFSIAT